MGWKELVNKEVFIKTKTSGVYSGVVENYWETEKILILIDIYNERIFINVDEILKAKEEPLNLVKSKKGVINKS